MHSRGAENLVSVVMPALNEADSIVSAIRAVPVAELARMGWDTEIIVVDNGSADGTPQLAEQAGARVVHEPRKGYGHAYRRGLREARGSIIATLDADDTYPAYFLPQLVQMLVCQDLDFINADRLTLLRDGTMPLTNRVGNLILTLACKVLFRLPFGDSQSGMWVFRRELLERMHLRSGGMAFSEEIKIEAGWRLKARCAEVPVEYHRRLSPSKLRVWRDGLGNLLFLLLKRLTERPEREASRPRLRGSATSPGPPEGEPSRYRQSP